MVSFAKIVSVALVGVFLLMVKDGRATRTVWTGEEFGYDDEVYDDDDDELSGKAVVNGNWASWSQWSGCSKVCSGPGKASRSRYCTEPHPENGGSPCVGPGFETRPCCTDKLTPHSERITGVQDAYIQDWPWQVGFQKKNNTIFCGGSLINREWVLTAAHCVSCFKRGERVCSNPRQDLRVVLGERDIRREVFKVYVHPKHDSTNMDYDIALVRLIRPLRNYNEFMSPICLSNSSRNFPVDTPCFVTGWGSIDQSGSTSRKLRVARVRVVDTSTCRQRYERTITDRMICAGYDQRMSDSCQGDQTNQANDPLVLAGAVSGGPLVCRENGRFVLYGAVSWGVGCANKTQPVVYSNVNNLKIRKWIDNTMRCG